MATQHFGPEMSPALIRLGDVRIAVTPFTAGGGAGSKIHVGLLQDASVQIDANVRPFFEVGSEGKWFVPDRPYATLRADRLFSLSSTANLVGGAYGCGTTFEEILSSLGFTLAIERASAHNTFGALADVLPECVFYLESYNVGVQVGNVVSLENITAVGEAQGVSANFTNELDSGDTW